MTNLKRENIAWIDLLRVIACFLVVLAHCCDPFVGKFDSDPSEFLAGVYWGSFCRPCVPLFVMISGVLLLPVKMEMGTFYRKRLSRIIIPFVVWSVITPFLFYFYLNTFGTVNPNIDMEAHTLSATITKMWTFMFNFNYDTIPLWYIYMLIGVYLFIPIISAWLNQATKKDVKRFLWIWVAATTIPFFQLLAPKLGYEGNYGSMGILGICDWNAYGTFYYFSGFLGYIVLAYYLVKYPPNWSLKKTLSIAIPLWIVGFVTTAFGFILTQKYFPGSYAQLEIIWYFSGTNVLMMTYSIFIIMQKLPVKSSKILSWLAALTFGIYLTHFFVVQVAYDMIYPTLTITPALKIIVIAASVFIITGSAVWVLSKLPKSKYITG